MKAFCLDEVKEGCNNFIELYKLKENTFNDKYGKVIKGLEELKDKVEVLKKDQLLFKDIALGCRSNECKKLIGTPSKLSY
jgi:hypothetical protein